MPKTKQQKQEILKQFTLLLDEAKAVVFSTFSGVDVANQHKLRGVLREQGVSYVVGKKTLIKRALKNKGIEGAEVDEWFGNIGIAVSKEDEVTPARLLVKLTKEIEGLRVEGGILEGHVIDKNEIKVLANLPGKDELIAKVVGSISAPLYGLVNVLKGPSVALLAVLNQIITKKES